MSINRFNTWQSLDNLTSITIADILTNSGLNTTLSQSSASGLIGHVGSGTGAVVTTVQKKLREQVSVKDFGAVGDGTTDDTAKFQLAVNYAASIGASLRLPAGTYKLTSTITLPTSNVALVGSGNGSQLYWAHTGHLFTVTSAQASYHAAEKFKVVSTVARSSTTASYVFNYVGGVIRSNYRDIEVIGDGTSGREPYGFFSSATTATQDTINFDNIELNGISGIGYNMSRGSSVWFHGGRVIGKSNAETTSVGLLMNGDMGGVWVWGTDFIFLGTGVWTANNGAGTNREIFLSQGCCDSCGQYGYRFSDSAYVSATGIWAASCDIANVQVDGTFAGVINISGGTVFNGGGYNLGGAGDGMVVNGGLRLTMAGVHFRNNKGYGIRHPQAAQPTTLSMTGCVATNNANNSIGGAKARVNGCLFSDNTNAPTVVSASGNCRVTNTTGINDIITVNTPSMPASGTAYTMGLYVPVVAFISGGTVTAIAVNGAQVMATSNVSIPLSPGDTITLTYSVAPTWSWIRADL